MIILLIKREPVSQWVLNKSVIIGLYGVEWVKHSVYQCDICNQIRQN